MKAYDRYCEDVLNDRIQAGIWIKKACQRYKRFRENPEFIFRDDLVDRYIRFVAVLKHYKGAQSGKSFILLDWQQFLFANLFGFYYANEPSKRVTESVYVQIARKNGKSFLSATIALICLILDRESSPEILFTAASREQATICFKQAFTLAKQLDTNSKYFKFNKKEIFSKHDDGLLKVLAADASRLDGWNPSLAIIDEYHAHKTSDVRDVMTSAQGARLNPLEIVITTAGFNLNVPCKELRDTCTKILNEEAEDDTQFSLIYELDEGDDWTDPELWIKANPCMGASINTRYIQKMITKAENSPSELQNVKTKTLNIWCNASDGWIDHRYISESSRPVDFEEFRDKPTFVGVDLSSVCDLTAVSFMSFSDGKLLYKTLYFLPEETLRSNKLDVAIFKEAKRRGHLIVTQGNVVDYDVITEHILEVGKIAAIDSIAYDKYNATQWALNMQNYYALIEYSQSLGSFNKPTKALERAILSGQLVMDTNVLTTFCFNNVKIKYDWNGNCKPDKSSNVQKIDGVISMIQCIGGYFTQGYDYLKMLE